MQLRKYFQGYLLIILNILLVSFLKQVIDFECRKHCLEYKKNITTKDWTHVCFLQQRVVKSYIKNFFMTNTKKFFTGDFSWFILFMLAQSEEGNLSICFMFPNHGQLTKGKENNLLILANNFKKQYLEFITITYM